MKSLQHLATGFAAILMLVLATTLRAAAPLAPVEFNAKVTYAVGRPILS